MRHSFLLVKMRPVMLMVLGAGFLLFASVSCKVEPGVYVDNGMGQSALDRHMTIAEKRELELEFLNLLGQY